VDLKEIRCEGLYWIRLAQGSVISGGLF
jgi:hypothetical protein